MKYLNDMKSILLKSLKQLKSELQKEILYYILKKIFRVENLLCIGFLLLL